MSSYSNRMAEKVIRYFHCHRQDMQAKQNQNQNRQMLQWNAEIRTSLDFGRLTFVLFKTADFKPNI